MKKTALLLLSAFLFASPLFAQGGGCVNSPENPTAVLGLVGIAGASLPALRARWRRRKVTRKD